MPCKHQVKECNCSNISMELRGSAPVDIFFVTEFPGRTECKEKKFLTGAHGKFFREILKRLVEKTKFTYAISGVTRSESKPGMLMHYSAEVRACLPNLEAEIRRCKPKVIVVLGDLPYSVFSKNNALPKHGSRVEDGILQPMNVFGKTRPVMYCQHTTWYMHNESCAVGFLYENIRKAIDFAQHGINPNIPNKFKSVTLRSLKDVKACLNDMATVDDYISVDTEGCNLLRVYGNKLLSVQLSGDGKTGYLIPYLHRDSPFINKIDRLRELFVNFFYEREVNTLGYLFVNAKYDYHQFYRELRRFSFNAPVVDASFAQYSLDENWVRVHSFPKQKGMYSLFTMSYKRGFTFYSDTDAKEKRSILEKIPLADWEQYAAADVVAPWHIFKKQLQEATRTGYREGFLYLNNIYENHLVRCLTYAEHCGLSMNPAKVKELVNSDSVIVSAIKDIMNRFYALPSVQEANAILSKGKTGMATGLAGAVRTWSPQSPKHRELLYFDILGLDPINEEDDGDASHTGKAFQKSYAGTPEVDLLTEYMSFTKMMSGFINPMSDYLDKNSSKGSPDMYIDNKARTHFSPLAVTGRLRSSNPNLQQRPAGRSKAAKTILSMYEPKPGRVVVKLDYKTFEVMGSGFLSGDKVMIKSFREMHALKEQFRANPRKFIDDGYTMVKQGLRDIRKGLKKKKQELIDSKGIAAKADYIMARDSFKKELAKYREELEALENLKTNDPIELSRKYVTLLTDSHRKFAALFFKTPVMEITKTQRQSAKTLVFGLLYGMSLASIAKSLKITEDEAVKLHETYMKSFPYAAKWLEQSKKFGQKHLYVQSPLGRRRRLWGHLRQDKGVAGKMNRYAGNTVIQGMCSDNNIIAGSLCVQAMEAHEKNKYAVPDEESWELTNLVHDSCEFEMPLEDTYYFIREFEPIYTEYLMMYLEKVFGFKIEIPLEVDFTVGTNYGNTKDWDGSEEDLHTCMKWLCEETAKRDKTKVVDYMKLVKSPLYKKFPKGFVLKVVKKAIKRDMARAERLGLYKNKKNK